jgi:hypothetical protein
LSRLIRIISPDSVHFVRKDGAFNCILWSYNKIKA